MGESRVPNRDKLMARARRNPAGLRFSEFETLIGASGFTLRRIKGDHHIFGRDDVLEIANAQPEGGMAKAYQVCQLLKLIERYGLPSEEDDRT